MIETLKDKVTMYKVLDKRLIYSHTLSFLALEFSPQTLDSVHRYVKSGLEC